MWNWRAAHDFITSDEEEDPDFHPISEIVMPTQQIQEHEGVEEIDPWMPIHGPKGVKRPSKKERIEAICAM
eukprot:4607088-Prorocentrum_lima.AAC.1